jgi:hypothetical protein
VTSTERVSFKSFYSPAANVTQPQVTLSPPIVAFVKSRTQGRNAVAWQIVKRMQHAAILVMGFLHGLSRDPIARQPKGFRHGLE